jgi:hypothetical protein
MFLLFFFMYIYVYYIERGTSAATGSSTLATTKAVEASKTPGTEAETHPLERRPRLLMHL